MSSKLFWEKSSKKALNYEDLILLMTLIEKYGIKAIIRQCKNSCEVIGDIGLADYLGEILN